MRMIKFSKGLWVVLIIYTVFMVADFASTFAVGSVVKHLETNPLYNLTGSFVPVIALNLALIVVIAWFYPKTTSFLRYNLIVYVMWTASLRLFVTINNLKIAANPPTVEVAQAISESAKVAQYNTTILLSLALPFIMCALIYLVFKIDHKIFKK